MKKIDFALLVNFFLHVNKLLDAQVVMIFRALDHCDQVLQGENFI